MKMKVCDLKLDYNLYPRRELNSIRVSRFVDAIRAGEDFPNIVADKKTKRVTDGFHRTTAFLKIDPQLECDVTLKPYGSESEMFKDAMRFNSRHGQPFSPFDQVHCLLKGESLKIELEESCECLGMTTERAEKLITKRAAEMKINSRTEKRGIKTTIKHKSGEILNAEQWEANKKLGGHAQTYYINQIIMLIKNDLLDVENEKVMERLKILHDLIGGVIATV